MTAETQNFNGYTDGQALPSDYFGSTPGVFWIINGTAYASAAAAFEGSLGAHITGNTLGITESHFMTEGNRGAASLFFKVNNAIPALDTATGGYGLMSVGLSSLGTLPKADQGGPDTPRDPSLFGFYYGGGFGQDPSDPDVAMFSSPGYRVSSGKWYFARLASRTDSDPTSGAAEGQLFEYNGTTWTKVIDWSTTITQTPADGGVMYRTAALTWGPSLGGADWYYDDIAWDDNLASGWPGYNIEGAGPTDGTSGGVVTPPPYVPPVTHVVTVSPDDPPLTFYGGADDLPTGLELDKLNPYLNITIWDRNFKFQQFIGDPVYASITPRWPGVGTAEIQLRSTDPANEWLQKQGANITVTYRDSQVIFSGPVESYQGSIIAGGTTTYQFSDWYTLLRETLGYVVPAGHVTPTSLSDPAQAYLAPGTSYVPGTAAGLGYYHWPSPVAETAIKTIAYQNFKRLGRPVVVRGSQNRGGTLTVDQLPQVRFDDLQTVCEAIALLSDLRIRIWLQPGNDHLSMEVYRIATYPRLLTYESGVLQEGTYSLNAPTATRVIVGGPGQDTDRAFFELDNRADEAAFRPIETFKDSTSNANLTWPSTVATDHQVAKYYPIEPGVTTAQRAAFTRALHLAAADVLTATGSTSGIEVRLSETDAFHFGGLDGFSVGDIITVGSGGVVFTDSVTECTLSWTVESFTVTPVVGKRSDETDVLLLQAVRHLAQTLRSNSTGR